MCTPHMLTGPGRLGYAEAKMIEQFVALGVVKAHVFHVDHRRTQFTRFLAVTKALTIVTSLTHKNMESAQLRKPPTRYRQAVIQTRRLTSKLNLTM